MLSTIEASQRRNEQKPYWLTDEVAKLPFRNIEGIKNVLAVQDKLKEGAFFRATTPQELEKILPKAAKKAQSIYSDLRALRKDPNEDWYNTLLREDLESWDKPFIKSGRNNIAEAVERLASDIYPKGFNENTYTGNLDFFRNMAHNMQNDLGRALRREVIRDIEGYERNPYLTILELYELGAANYLFFGFHKVDGERALVVDFMLKPDQSANIPFSTVGCAVFRPDNSYDRKIEYIHSLSSSHQEIRPITPTRIIS